MEKDHVVVKVLDNTSINVLPRYESTSAAGMDVRTNFGKYTAKELRNRAGENFAVIEEADGSCNRIVLYPQGRYLFPTGLFVAIPVGYEAQIRPRSGLALKTGVTVLNTPGTIDADYRGEIGIILVNTSETSVTINDQERLCQMVLAKVEHLRWDIVTELPTTIRGDGGFGHTGNK